MLHDGKGEKIRLYGIDTPEKRQAFGKRAKQFTSDMVFDQIAEVEAQDIDRYGRTVGLVNVKSQSLNEALIKNGYAWVYRHYCKKDFCKDWISLESAARENKIGLWSEPNPIPPWDFRHGKANIPPAQKAVFDQGGIEYHGNSSSKIFHKPGCRHYDCKDCTATFETRETAIQTVHVSHRNDEDIVKKILKQLALVIRDKSVALQPATSNGQQATWSV